MGCVFLSGELAEVVLTLWLERAKKKKKQKIVAICVLAQLAHDSYQIKHAVTFVS